MTTSAQAISFRRRILLLIAVPAFLYLLYTLVYPLAFDRYTGVTNARLDYDTSVALTDAEFEQLRIGYDRTGAAPARRGNRESGSG